MTFAMANGFALEKLLEPERCPTTCSGRCSRSSSPACERWSRRALRLESGETYTPGTTGFDVVGSVGVVASRGPGWPRKTPGKTISADSHEYALAA